MAWQTRKKAFQMGKENQGRSPKAPSSTGTREPHDTRAKSSNVSRGTGTEKCAGNDGAKKTRGDPCGNETKPSNVVKFKGTLQPNAAKTMGSYYHNVFLQGPSRH